MSKKDLDINGDGKIQKNELRMYNRKMITQRNMAIASLVAIIIAGFYLLGVAPETRLEAMGSLLDLYWITLGGVIATYMGTETYSYINRPTPIPRRNRGREQSEEYDPMDGDGSV